MCTATGGCGRCSRNGAVSDRVGRCVVETEAKAGRRDGRTDGRTDVNMGRRSGERVDGLSGASRKDGEEATACVQTLQKKSNVVPMVKEKKEKAGGGRTVGGRGREKMTTTGRWGAGTGTGVTLSHVGTPTEREKMQPSKMSEHTNMCASMGGGDVVDGGADADAVEMVGGEEKKKRGASAVETAGGEVGVGLKGGKRRLVDDQKEKHAEEEHDNDGDDGDDETQEEGKGEQQDEEEEEAANTLSILWHTSGVPKSSSQEEDSEEASAPAPKKGVKRKKTYQVSVFCVWSWMMVIGGACIVVVLHCRPWPGAALSACSSSPSWQPRSYSCSFIDV